MPEQRWQAFPSWRNQPLPRPVHSAVWNTPFQHWQRTSSSFHIAACRYIWHIPQDISRPLQICPHWHWPDMNGTWILSDLPPFQLIFRHGPATFLHHWHYPKGSRRKPECLCRWMTGEYGGHWKRASAGWLPVSAPAQDYLRRFLHRFPGTWPRAAYLRWPRHHPWQISMPQMLSCSLAPCNLPLQTQTLPFGCYMVCLNCHMPSQLSRGRISPPHSRLSACKPWLFRWISTLKTHCHVLRIYLLLSMPISHSGCHRHWHKSFRDEASHQYFQPLRHFGRRRDWKPLKNKLKDRISSLVTWKK